MTTLPKSANHLAAKILHWDDERAIGNPIIVTLAHGFAFDDNNVDDLACHVRGFDTVMDAVKGVRSDATPCGCSRCTPSRRASETET